MKPTEDKYSCEMESVLDGLKSDINNFLFSRLPGKITLAEFEEFATDLFEKIRDEWDKHGE